MAPAREEEVTHPGPRGRCAGVLRATRERGAETLRNDAQVGLRSNEQGAPELSRASRGGDHRVMSGWHVLLRHPDGGGAGVSVEELCSLAKEAGYDFSKVRVTPLLAARAARSTSRPKPPVLFAKTWYS